MRVQQALTNELDEFSRYLLDVGNGRVETRNTPEGFSTDLIRIPERMLIPGSNLIHLLEATFPSLFNRSERSNFPMHYLQGQWEFFLRFINRSILTATNVEVNTFNDLVMNEFPRVEKVFLSQDSVCTEDHALLYPPEVINTINTGSLPPHCLKLKKNWVPNHAIKKSRS
jgi:hypothetical protein